MFIVECLCDEEVALKGPEIVEQFSKGQCDEVLGVRRKEMWLWEQSWNKPESNDYQVVSVHLP